MILLTSSIHSASSRLTISRLAPSVQNLSSLAWAVWQLVTVTLLARAGMGADKHFMEPPHEDINF